MAKKATTTKQNNNNEPGKFAMMKMFFTNERTRFITGLVIAIITIYIGLALISFFFTGGADQSKIENVPSLRRNVLYLTRLFDSCQQVF